jgi:phosphoglycerate dehydrogenase-like enzyme
VLPGADFVVLAVPLTPATQNLISADRLARMRKDAYLINVSRGPLIDDPALISALRGRRIAGAALDVFAEEPLPPDSPYWGFDNVLITPHTAAVTEKLWERHYQVVRENLARFLRGEPLLYVVDKRKGY